MANASETFSRRHSAHQCCSDRSLYQASWGVSRGRVTRCKAVGLRLTLPHRKAAHAQSIRLCTHIDLVVSAGPENGSYRSVRLAVAGHMYCLAVG